MGVDFGVRHLATLSLAVEDFTDEFGLVKKPRHLNAVAGKLAKVDRAIARCQKKSKNRAKLVRCRARLYGPRKRTRDLELHPLTTIQAGSLDAVVLEDLSVTSMTKRFAGDGRKGRRRNVFDAGFVSFDVSSPTRPLIEGPRWS